MPCAIPASHADILLKRAFGHLATTCDDGAPHVTPVWVEPDAGDVLVNSALGRRKDRNIVRDPRVALSILDPDDPYRYIGLQGEVVERLDDDGRHNNHLSLKYHGEPFPFPSSDRVIYRIRPMRVWTMG